MAIPINKQAGPDNSSPAVHLMSRLHDVPVSDSGLSFGMCHLAMASHGYCHTMSTRAAALTKPAFWDTSRAERYPPASD
jgi:hypothetical protein